MGKINDLTGKRFGKLTVIEYTGRKTNKSNNAIWLCRCDCGKYVEVRSNNLTATKRPQKSCGCIKTEVARAANLKHGGKHERLYGVWMGMRRRCSDKSLKDYNRYGARGIKVCDEWQNYGTFREWAIENGYNPAADFQKCTLDRIDPNGNYEPSNCRWVDIKTQENNRRNNRLIEHNGKTQSLKMWSEELGVRYDLLTDRIRNGWDFEKAVLTPVRTRRKKDFNG